MEITNGADLTHIARTTEQWSRKYDRHVIIPKGVLCIEFTPSGETKIKIGDGHKVFAQLPYIGNSSSVIIDAYTKDETIIAYFNYLIKNKLFVLKVILIMYLNFLTMQNVVIFGLLFTILLNMVIDMKSIFTQVRILGN